MKLKITRRVALLRQYEFTEIEITDIKTIKQAMQALEQNEVLAKYAREVEIIQPQHWEAKKKYWEGKKK